MYVVNPQVPPADGQHPSHTQLPIHTRRKAEWARRQLGRSKLHRDGMLSAFIVPAVGTPTLVVTKGGKDQYNQRNQPEKEKKHNSSRDSLWGEISPPSNRHNDLHPD